MRAKIQQIVDGKSYNTETATLIASNEYWDGSNWERGGTNCHLYRTPRGRYFLGYSTCWQGERDHIEPIDIEEAKRMYEQLGEQELDFEDAFPGETIEEA